MRSFRSAEQRVPAHPPVCSVCGTPMRLISAEPAEAYENLKRAKFECDCGRSSQAMVADNE